MATSDTSFGKKLRNGQDLLTFVQGFAGYVPPRAQESVAALQALLSSVITANATEAITRQQYRAAVDARANAFRTGNNSIAKLTTLIRAAVEAQYGKKSGETSSIHTLIRSLRAVKPTAAPVNPDQPDAVQTISRSQLSYGSQTQHFNDLINTLNQLNGYNPSNTAIKIATLQTFVTQLSTLNNTVTQKFAALQMARATRTALYADLKDRTQRAKSYVKAQYGTVSNEYKLIKGLSV